MRAFMSIILVAALLAPLLVLVANYSRAEAESRAELADAAVAEAAYYEGMDLKHAVEQALVGAARENNPNEPNSIERTALAIGGRLEALESFVEGEGLLEGRGNRAGGSSVDLWCGIAGRSELAGGRRCARCWDAREKVVVNEVDLKGEYVSSFIANKCAFLVNVDVLRRRAGVSLGGISMLVAPGGRLRVVDDVDLNALALSGADEIVIGASVERNGISYNTYIPNGVWFDYG